MNIPLAMIFLGSLIFCAHVFNSLFDRTKIPNALLLMLIGILVGPVLKLINEDHFGSVGPVFTTATLIIIMFESGIHLKIEALLKSIGSALLLTVFNFVVSVAVATVAAHYLSGIEFSSALFFGVIVAGTSSAIVIPMVKQLSMNKEGENILLLESALSDVLCLVVGLALLEGLKAGSVSIVDVLNNIWKSFLIAAAIGVISSLVWAVIINKIRLVENYTFTTLAFVFMIYGISELLGLNGGIAALMFGITLGNAYLIKMDFLTSEMAPKKLLSSEESFFAELVFILTTYFFVYVGVCIQFSDPMVYVIALLIIVAITMIRPLFIRFFTKSSLPVRDKTFMAIMAPKGLVPIILASLPLQLGIAGGEEIKNLAYALVLVSIVFASVLVIVFSNDNMIPAFLKRFLAVGAAHDLGGTDAEHEGSTESGFSLAKNEESTSDQSDSVASEKEDQNALSNRSEAEQDGSAADSAEPTNDTPTPDPNKSE